MKEIRSCRVKLSVPLSTIGSTILHEYLEAHGMRMGFYGTGVRKVTHNYILDEGGEVVEVEQYLYKNEDEDSDC